jgi:SAM-dependent methyltransferase
VVSGRIGRHEGRRLFGLDPAAYDSARPGHAPRAYDILVERCGLAAGTRVLEVGPGTGQATRRLLDLGARILALEPDPALAAYLEATLGAGIEIRVAALEDAELEAAGYDLAVAASSFHWVDEEVGLARLFAALRPGGWIALWWTLFGDPGKPDAFIQATSPLLENLKASPTHAETPERPPHALDATARVEALRRRGFEDIEHETVRWEAGWNTAGIRALYGTFSPVARLDAASRNDLLDGVARIAERDFGGRVQRTLITSIYTARKPR